MDNHIHLAMISGAQILSEWIHPLNTGFAQAVNLKRRKSGKKTLGPVFAERPSSKVYDCKVAINIIGYIHNNPCRAGIVTNPASSPWTSHRAYLGVQEAPSFLDVELGLDLCGLDKSDENREQFHDLVCARASLELVEVKPIGRNALETESTDGFVVSDSPKAPDPAIAEPFRESISCEEMTLLASERLGIDYKAMMSGCRRRDVAAARRLSLLVWDALGRHRVEMARHLKITLPSSADLLNNRTRCDVLRNRVDELLDCCRGDTK